MLTSFENVSADNVLMRFTAAVEDANATMNKPYTIEYSVGLEHFQHNTEKTSEEVIQDADAAMYKHKKGKVRQDC
jgi:GGDEF domain-containing protein